MSVIIADTGPLIALSCSRRLILLSQIFDTVLLPSVVLEELRLDEGRPGVEALADAIQTNTWLKVVDPKKTPSIIGLDAGEAAAIQLALEKKCPLLIDERKGRIEAKKAGVNVVGTGRVLLAAKEHGFISLVGAELQTLQYIGYRLSPSLIARLLELAGEN